MSTSLIILIVLGLGVVAFVTGRSRALAVVDGDRRKLHSLPGYYGAFVGLNTVVPAMLALILWLLVQPFVVNNSAAGMIDESNIAEGSSLSLVMSDVRRVADGLDIAVDEGALTREAAANLETGSDDVRGLLADVGVVLGSDVTAETLQAAQRFRGMSATGNLLMTLLVLVISVAGFGVSWRMVTKDYRARNLVEQGIMLVLIGAASIAILTTVGIVLSLVFNTYEFFKLYSPLDFFFGLNWSPSFSGRGSSSQLGILPLLWGTLYISLIALLVAASLFFFFLVYPSVF